MPQNYLYLRGPIFPKNSGGNCSNGINVDVLMEIAKVNSWNSEQTFCGIKVHLTGHAQMALQHLSGTVIGKMKIQLKLWKKGLSLPAEGIATKLNFKHVGRRKQNHWLTLLKMWKWCYIKRARICQTIDGTYSFLPTDGVSTSGFV